jgi:Flp pilus assembly protein TadD
LEKRPEDAHVRFLFAVVLEQSGRSAHAMGQYEQVLVLAPKHIGALNNLAWMLQKQGEPRALALAKGAYQLNSDNPKVADTYGWTLARFGRLQDAMVIFDVARKAFPQDEDLARHHRAVTRVLRGETSVLRDDPVAND